MCLSLCKEIHKAGIKSTEWITIIVESYPKEFEFMVTKLSTFMLHERGIVNFLLVVFFWR